MTDRPLPSVVGSSRQWAIGAARLGGALGLGTSASLGAEIAWLSPGALAHEGWAFTLTASFVTTCAMAVGAALGAVAPRVMDRVRGRVPLTVLVPAQAVVGGAAGVTVAALLVAALTALEGAIPAAAVLRLLAFAGSVGAVGASAWWLPFTVATVLGRQWPVAASVGVVVPPLVLLAFVLALA